MTTQNQQPAGHTISSQQVWATRLFFFLAGFGIASWAPLVPLLRERLQITDDVLGMLLLCIGIGSLVTMPLSGKLSGKYGCRAVMRFSSVVFSLLLLSLLFVSNIYMAIVLLLLFGAFMGSVDVVMNIAAVMVQEASGRRILSGMHAFYSIGGFAGAGLYGLWVGMLGLTATESTLIAVAIMFAIIALYSRHLLPYGDSGEGKLIAIPRGIVLAIGSVAFISYLVEGATMDWSGVFLTTVRGWDMSLAGMGFTTFNLAMLLMRLLGDKTVENLGQKLVVVGGCLIAALGFFTVTVSSATMLTYAGFFAIGIGCANIVPVLFTLLGKQKVMPISEAIAASSTMGYLGILAGPAAIGFVSHATSLLTAFFMLTVLILLQAAISFMIYRKIEA